MARAGEAHPHDLAVCDLAVCDLGVCDLGVCRLLVGGGPELWIGALLG